MNRREYVHSRVMHLSYGLLLRMFVFYVFEDYLYMGFLFLDYFDLFEVDLFY